MFVDEKVDEIIDGREEESRKVLVTRGLKNRISLENDVIDECC